MDQSAKKLALVEPSNFNFNRETFETNVLQKDININKKVIFSEFDNKFLKVLMSCKNECPFLISLHSKLNARNFFFKLK